MCLLVYNQFATVTVGLKSITSLPYASNFKVQRLTSKKKPTTFRLFNPGAQHAGCCLLLVVFWIASMLRVTAREILLFYLVVDGIINPVDLASGKTSRCIEIFAYGLCLNLFYFDESSCREAFCKKTELPLISCRSRRRFEERAGGRG